MEAAKVEAARVEAARVAAARVEATMAGTEVAGLVAPAGAAVAVSKAVSATKAMVGASHSP